MKKTVCIFKARIKNLPYWDPDSIQTGLSGSEEAIIYSAEALQALNFKVYVLNNIPNKEKYSNSNANPCYSGYLRRDDFFDFAILHDDAEFTNILRPRTRKLYFIANNPCKEPLKDDEIDAFDDVLWLSQDQRKQWIEKNPKMAKFTKIFGNAVNPAPFKPVKERTNPYSCIYASDYARGLYHLLKIWPNIKQDYPLATLDIYYGLRNWGVMCEVEENFIRDGIKYLKSYGVTDHGQVGHLELTEAFSNASFWTYPCSYPETFCITALKAQLAGTIPVIVEKAALAETVKFGFKCKTQEEYEALLLNAMSKAKNITLQEREQMGSFVLENFTWNKMTTRWSQLFR